SISRRRIFSALATAIADTSPRSSSRARWISCSTSARASSSCRSRSRAPSALPSATISLARACAWSRIVFAWARASEMIFSASRSASASFCWPRSAAASPSAMRVWRSSMARMMKGQTKRIVNQTNTTIAIVWPSRVRLMFIRSPLRSGQAQARASAAERVLELADERVRESEVERDADADHRHGVEQGDHQEHLRLQHGGELRLARRALQEAAAEQAHADADAQRAQPDQDRDGDGGVTNHSFHRCL